MKYSKSLLLAVIALTAGIQVQASEAVIFQCVLDDGNSVMVEHNADNDAFTLTYGKDLYRPELTIRKAGNNLGTAVQMSREEASLNRDLYVTDGDKLYTVNFNDVAGRKSGTFQIMEAGVEESYADCDPKSLRSSFDDYELFVNLTPVD